MNNQPVNNDSANHQDDQPDCTRRRLGLGLLAVLGGGLGAAHTAQAFPRGAAGHFIAASHILRQYGIKVFGRVDRSTRPAHDVITTEVVPIRGTEYVEVVGTPDRRGELIPCVKTAVFGDDANFTHFHPGEIIPCLKTAIEGHSQATHELFDSDQDGLDPCYRVESEMLDGGHIGTIAATHFHPTDEGGIVPCVKTTIEGHSLATHELFDSDQGGVDPCYRVESEMLEGGHIGTIAATHFHPTDAGGIVPCVKTTIEGHSLATHELFDSDQGGITPCYRVESEMLDGGHIGTITATHFHPTGRGGMDPCFRSTIEGHSRTTYELLEASAEGPMPSFTVATQMGEGGVLVVVDVTIDNPNLALVLRVGGNSYALMNGELVLERVL